MSRLTHKEITDWLRETRPAALERLFAQANEARRAHVGDAVHLRGLIEISSYCVRQCHYCGLRSERAIPRYRMTRDKILQCAHTAVHLGFGSIVLQAGEDFGIEAAWLAEIVRTIKAETPLTITLSLGERLSGELRTWRDAGADRYLLRFETSDPTLYAAIHPQRGTALCDRVALLREMRELGYEIGSGVMVGIPGQ
jgi:biotin synthase